MRTHWRLCIAAAAAVVVTLGSGAGIGAGQASGSGAGVPARQPKGEAGVPADQLGVGEAPAVPTDLRSLLQPRQSEMRLVQLRYTLDRSTLAANYLGGLRPAGTGGRGGQGASPSAGETRPGAPAPSTAPSAAPSLAGPAPSLSPNRIARLKRFDLDWQAALARLDAGRLSPAGKADLEALQKSVESNLRQLDEDAVTLADLSPLLPFAPAIVQLVEARIRMDDMNAEKAAGVLNDVSRQVRGLSRPEAAASAAAATVGMDASRASSETISRAADGVSLLRTSLAEWFAFYNGYDPLFTWWMGLPYKRVDADLQAYGKLLRDRVAGPEANSTSPGQAEAGPAANDAAGRTAKAKVARLSSIAAAPPPRFASVPDLAELVALPQDEMTGIVQRFRSAVGQGGRSGPEAAKVAPKDRGFFESWLAALKTLDFDTLSRNAQVDYLYIRATAERQLARLDTPLPANPPRKADTTGIPGAARGRQGLIFDLQDDLVPYTPEELIAVAEKEFAWCEREMKKASREMGLGDDWKKAIENVKEIHPPPGGQVKVVRDLMFEAVDYLRAKDLLTVPAVAAESLRMIMMTPERQLVNPFFTGGSLISVSYPADSMEYEARLQSLRGNNTPFSHATAFHEMIPGHNLVFYTNARFAPYRASLASGSPFYSEGWPLYWELQLYDLGFDDTPQERVGALFWRMHRCARIVFSLKFHLGEWSPQQCIDYLVDRVAFERDNATAEVRRSFQGGYGPLYQAAYLLGGMQLRALRRELVEGGGMGAKRFHDEVLRQGNMPIALLRLAIGRQKLSRDMSLEWKFAGS